MLQSSMKEPFFAGIKAEYAGQGCVTLSFLSCATSAWWWPRPAGGPLFPLALWCSPSRAHVLDSTGQLSSGPPGEVLRTSWWSCCRTILCLACRAGLCVPHPLLSLSMKDEGLLDFPAIWANSHFRLGWNLSKRSRLSQQKLSATEIMVSSDKHSTQSLKTSLYGQILYVLNSHK